MSNMKVTLSLSATIRYNWSSPPVLPLARLRNSSTSVVSLLVVCSDIEFSHAKCQALLLLLLLLLLLFPPARTASLVPALQIFTCPSRFSALCDKPLVDKGGKLNNFHPLRLTHCVSFGVYQLASGVLLSCAWYLRVSRVYSKWQGVNIISGSLTCMYHVWMTFPMMY